MIAAAGAPQQGNIIRPEGHASYPARSWPVPIPGIKGRDERWAEKNAQGHQLYPSP